MHIQCLICSDVVNQAENIYVTKCGHLFHHHCLSQWIDRSRTCPQCRCVVSASGMFRVFPTAGGGGGGGGGGEDAGTLQGRLDDAQLQLRQQRAALLQLEARVREAQEQTESAQSQVSASEKRLLSAQSAVTALREQLAYLKVQNKETERLRQENEALHKNIQTLNALERVLNATAEEVEQMLAGYTDVRTIATFATALKRALCESESQKSESREALRQARDAARQAQEAARQVSDMARQARAQLATEKARVLKLQEQLDRQSSRGSKRPRVALAEAESKSDTGTAEPTITSGKSPAPSPEAKSASPAAASSDTSVMSPYLSLRASALPLAALRHSHLRLKPSEQSVLKSARSAIGRHSIFGDKSSGGQVGGHVVGHVVGQYDGLGGHARPDPAPLPRAGTLPRPGVRHRLRRPAPAAPASRDIADMFNQIREHNT